MKKIMLTLSLAALLPQISFATIPAYVHLIPGPPVTQVLKCNSESEVRNNSFTFSLKVITQAEKFQAITLIEASVLVQSTYNKPSEIKLKQDYQAAYNAIFTEKKIKAEFDKYPLSAKLNFNGFEYICKK